MHPYKTLKVFWIFFSVTNKLAACVNIIPGIISVYEWEGKINNDEEVLVRKIQAGSVDRIQRTKLKENRRTDEMPLGLKIQQN